MLTFAEWRRAKNISREKLAEACNVHINTVMNWEKNPGKIPISKAETIAEVLGVAITDIIFTK